MARQAVNLEVAQVPPIEASHLQRASELNGNNGTHIVIVGAGAAGLSAAYTLEYLGLPYTVLEASSTIGGRVQEMTDFVNVPLDLGAEWIHVMPRFLQDLLLFEEDTAQDIEIIEYQPRKISVYARGKRRRRNWFSHFYLEYKFANTTWWSYFDEKLYPHVADRVFFNAVVNRIEYMQGEGDQVSKSAVTTADGQRFDASHVILTAPIRMLQDRAIEFVPDLSARTWNAVDEVIMADGMKVWFEWDENFYPDALLTKSIFSGLENQPMYFNAVWGKSSYTDAHVLFLFNVNTKEASQRASWSDEEIIQQALDQLETIFDRSDLRDHLVQSRVQNWSREPYIRGAYTFNYGDFDQDTLRSPLHQGHLFFAGEHIAAGDEYVATVHGAAITGREAVLKILSTTTE